MSVDRPFLRPRIAWLPIECIPDPDCLAVEMDYVLLWNACEGVWPVRTAHLDTSTSAGMETDLEAADYWSPLPQDPDLHQITDERRTGDRYPVSFVEPGCGKRFDINDKPEPAQ